MTINPSVAIEQGADGRVVMIEPADPAGKLSRRVFRYCADYSLEWCSLADWRENGARARFYGYFSRELPSSMTDIRESV